MEMEIIEVEGELGVHAARIMRHLEDEGEIHLLRMQDEGTLELYLAEIEEKVDLMLHNQFTKNQKMIVLENQDSYLDAVSRDEWAWALARRQVWTAILEPITDPEEDDQMREEQISLFGWTKKELQELDEEMG